MKKTTKKIEEPKMLLFSRDVSGYWVKPHSVIAWLYYNKSPKLAEEFAKSFNGATKKLDKKYTANDKNILNKWSALSETIKPVETKEIWWKKLKI